MVLWSASTPMHSSNGTAVCNVVMSSIDDERADGPAGGRFDPGRVYMPSRFNARLAARPAIARGTLAAAPLYMDGATAFELVAECAGEAERVARLAPARAAAILASGDQLARAWANESSDLGLRPPQCATVNGSPRAVWCPVNPESCSSAGAIQRVSLARPHGIGATLVAADQRRADRALARLLDGEAIGKRTRRGKRGGRKHKQ